MTIKKRDTTKTKIRNIFVYFCLFIFLFSFSVIVFAETTDPNINGMPKKSAMLYPLPEAVDVGKEIEFDLIINPFLEGVPKSLQKLNHYEFRMSFNPNAVKLQFVESLLPNFEIKQTGSTGEVIVKAVGVDPAADVYYFEPTKLLKFKFLATKESKEAPVKIDKLYLMNSLGEGGTEAELITDLFDGKLAVLEEGLNTYINEYYAGNSNTINGYGSRTQYWNLTEPEKDEVFEAWDLLSAEEKAKYAQCVPSCEAKQCGTDGCGGFCGTDDGLCLNGNECFDFKCTCQPNCFGKVCGDNSCGGLCSDRKCTKYDEHRIPGQIWNKWYTYLLIILVLVILIGSLIFSERGKIKGKYQQWKLRRQEAKQAKALDKHVQQHETRQQTRQEATQPAVEVPTQLTDYINKQRSKGFNKDQIQKSLLNVGWKKDLINNAFKKLGI